MIRLLFILFICSFSAFSQDIYFKTLTTDDGLSNNSVNDIENDKNGALWIGTWDGLNYYDGNEFKVFKHIAGDSTSLSGNEILKIIKAKKDTLWVLTDSGLSKHIGNGVFKNYFFEERISNIFLSENNEPTVKLISGTHLTYNGVAFVSLVAKSNLKNQEHFVYKNILLSKKPTIKINDVFINKDKVLFATQLNGLFVLRIVNGIYQIKNYRQDPYSPTSFKSNEIEEIHQDIFGGIWLAFKDGGISLIQESMKGVSTIMPHPDDYPHLPSETIRAITKDAEENLWLGYYSKGLQRFSKKTNCFLPFELPKSLENKDWNRIRSLFKDSKGAIWVGTYAGVARIFEENIQYFSAKDHKLFPNNRNYSFFEDKTGHLWIGCWGGVAKININTLKFKPFKNQDILKKVHIRSVCKHKSKLLLATENSSLLIFDLNKGNVKQITEKEGLAGNSVFSILYVEKTNQFWASSLGGISIINENGKVLKTITEKNGLPSHMVYGILKANDKIWASTTKGISKISVDENKVEKINSSKKWQSTEFSEGAYFKDKHETLYFGGVKGLSYFSPKDLMVSVYLPKIDVSFDTKVTSEKIIIKSYDENFLKAKVTPIAFEKNTNNKVLYKLNGYDKNWKELKEDHTIFYKKLPPNTYNLIIKNSLDDNRNSLNYKIVINKPFYLSNWFLILLLSTLVCSILYYLYNKNLRIKRYQKKLKTEINKRIQTIKNQKEELLKLHNSIRDNEFEVNNFKKFIIEKFKQPLNLILENVSDAVIYPEKKELVANEVKKLISKVLEWDYLEDVYTLSDFKKSIAKADFLKESLYAYKELFLEKNVNYQVNLSSSVEVIELDIVRSKLIFQYLLNVFLNYRKEKTSLIINIDVTEKKINLKANTDNKLLSKNFNEVKKYSTYFKAFKKLLTDLEGTFTKTIKNERLIINVTIPVIPYKKTENIGFKKTVLDLSQIPADKKIILVYANSNDFNIAECLLESTEYYLLFENNLKDASKFISKTERISLLVYYNISFSSEVIELSKFISKNKTLPTIYISEKIDFFLQEKTEEYYIDELIQLPVGKKFIQNKIKRLVNNMPSYKTSKKDKAVILSVNQKYVDDAIVVIKQSYDNPEFNVELLTEKLKISRVKCYRMFKEVLHQSPSDYISQFRMKKALDFMKDGNLNISQISFECGFNDPKYFSKAFKKFYGVTPKKYMEKNV